MIKNFQKLIKTDKYQVFLFVSPCNIPFSFAAHPWFVCVKKGKISRWDILFRKNKKCKASWGHLYLNYFSPFSGIEIIPFYKRYCWKAKIIGYIEGDEKSVAKKMLDFIENSKNNYPFCYKYSFIGSNSNTYAQNILNHFPEFKLKLPWNAFGKNYNMKNKN